MPSKRGIHHQRSQLFSRQYSDYHKTHTALENFLFHSLRYILRLALNTETSSLQNWGNTKFTLVVLVITHFWEICPWLWCSWIIVLRSTSKVNTILCTILSVSARDNIHLMTGMLSLGSSTSCCNTSAMSTNFLHISNLLQGIKLTTHFQKGNILPLTSFVFGFFRMVNDKNIYYFSVSNGVPLFHIPINSPNTKPELSHEDIAHLHQQVRKNIGWGSLKGKNNFVKYFDWVNFFARIIKGIFSVTKKTVRFSSPFFGLQSVL